MKNTNQHEEAINTLYLAKKSATKSGEVNLILNVKNNLSGMLLLINNIEEAKKEVLECINDSVKYNVKSTLHHCRSNLGHIELELGNYPEAIEILQQTKKAFESNNNIKAMTQQQLSLSTAYERSGDCQKALAQLKNYYEQYIKLMFNERTNEINRVEQNYETKLKDKQIDLLNTNNDLQAAKLREKELSNTLLILVLVFSAILLFFFVRRYILIKLQKMY